MSLGSGRRARGGHGTGLFHYNSGHHGRGHSRHIYYPAGHYYYGYSALYYAAYPYYPAGYGVTYISSYYDDPYRYSSYDYDDSYERDSGVGTAVLYEGGADTSSAVLSGPYPTVRSESVNGLLTQGNAAFKAGQYGEARGLYARAMLSDERDGYAKLLYALANFAARDYAVAETALRRALLTAPELLDFPFDLRPMFAHTALWETHLGDLVRYLAAHPDDRGAALLLAYLHHASGDAARALLVLAPLAKSDPNDVVVALLHDRLLQLRN